jgi:hypothetical protein
MASDRLRQRLSGRSEIVGEIGQRVSLEATGKHFRCACPRHDAPTPPLYVHPDRGIFTCFGCGFAGDLVELIAGLDHVSVAEATTSLCESLGIRAEEMSETADGAEGADRVGTTPGPTANVVVELLARELNITPEKAQALLARYKTGATAETATQSATGDSAARPDRPPDEERERETAAIVTQDNLLLAWRKVKTFADEHDVYFDSQMFEQYERRLEANLYVLGKRLERMVADSVPYRPAPFRHLRLAKPGGGHRDIAILSQVEDRVVIQAVLNVLAPRIAQGFSPNSFGHRLASNFGQTDLVFERWPVLWHRYQEKLRRFLWTPEPYAYIKGDIAAFYDQVDRNRLSGLIAVHVKNEWTLATIEKYLAYDLVLDDGKEAPSGPRGLPQGPAYAHFFANLYLDAFDHFVEDRIAADQGAMLAEETRRLAEWLGPEMGAAFMARPHPTPRGREALGYCRYVDDFFILFDSREAAEGALTEITEKMGEFGLALSAEKTGIHEAEDMDPVIEEMKSRKYTLGKLLDNDASLTMDQREALYQVVENDLLAVATEEDLGRAAKNIGFVVRKLSESSYFDRNEDALLNLVIELLFSESFKHSAMSGVLAQVLPRIVRTHFAAEFVRHLKDPATPNFKRVLFLRSVQEHRLHAELGPEMKECVRSFLQWDCFFVRFAAANCLWANDVHLPFQEVRRLYDQEVQSAVRGRLLHVMEDGGPESMYGVFLEIAVSTGAERNYHALLAAQGSRHALSRVLRHVDTGHDGVVVEWLIAVLQHGGSEAVDSLNRRLEHEEAVPRITEVLGVILGRACDLYESRFVTRKSILKWVDNLGGVRNQRVRDLLFTKFLVPARAQFLETSDEELCTMLAAHAERIPQEDGHLQNVLRQLPSGAKAEDVGFLGEVGLAYHAYRSPGGGQLDIWEVIDADRVIRDGRFADAYAWQEYIEAARKRGLADFRRCDVVPGGPDEPSQVWVHYCLGSQYQRVVDLVGQRRRDEPEAVRILTAVASTCAGLAKLAKGRTRAPTITPYNVAVDLSGNVRFIGLASAFFRPRYVSCERQNSIEDAPHSDSLFLGWLSFELVTGLCPLTELKRLRKEKVERAYLTYSPALTTLSLFYFRVLRRLTYETAEYRSPVTDRSVRLMLSEYARDVEQLRRLIAESTPAAALAEGQLLAFWERRVADTWRNPTYRGQGIESRMSHAYFQVLEDTVHFCATRGFPLGEYLPAQKLEVKGLHLASAGADRLLRCVEEAQFRTAVSAGSSAAGRFNLVLMFLVLRCETAAVALAVWHRHWESWSRSETATQFRQCADKASYLAEILKRGCKPQANIFRRESLVPLADDLALLVEGHEQQVPFSRCGLAALASFAYLVARDTEDASGTEALLSALSRWENRVGDLLSSGAGLSPEAYQELGAEQCRLVEQLGGIPQGRVRCHGLLTESCLSSGTRGGTVAIDGQPEAVGVGQRGMVAIGWKAVDRTILQGDRVSVDLLNGHAVALSRLGHSEKKLFALATSSATPGMGETCPLVPSQLDVREAAVREPMAACFLLETQGRRALSEAEYRETIANAASYDLLIDMTRTVAAGRYLAGRSSQAGDFEEVRLKTKFAAIWVEFVERGCALRPTQLKSVSVNHPDKLIEQARSELDLRFSRYAWRAIHTLRADSREAKRFHFNPPEGFRMAILLPPGPPSPSAEHNAEG